MTTQEQKIRYLEKFPLTGDEEQADWWITQREEELKELMEEMKELQKRFHCGACDGAKCGHTQCCEALEDIKSLITNKLK